MWAGASVQIEYFVYGAILMTFGFTFAQAVALIVLGNLSFLLLGSVQPAGPRRRARPCSRSAVRPTGPTGHA